MRKYNVLNLYVLEYEGRRFICEPWIQGKEYIEVLSKTTFKINDDIKIEKLSNFYSPLSIINLKTQKPLLLSKKDILNKYLEINAELFKMDEKKELSELSNDLKSLREELMGLSSKDPNQAIELAKEALIRTGVIKSSLDIEFCKTYSKSNDK